jgi:hypothetical protein
VGVNVRERNATSAGGCAISRNSIAPSHHPIDTAASRLQPYCLNTRRAASAVPATTARQRIVLSPQCERRAARGSRESSDVFGTSIAQRCSC